MLEHEITFHPVGPSRWGDFEELFESRGGPKNCWCMLWRQTPEEARHRDNRSRKGFMEKRICNNVPVGILGYHQRKPMAWCSIAPKSTYRNLTGKTKTPETKVWSLACFYIKNEYRKKGLTKRLIQAAINYAEKEGAEAIEAYPVDPDSPSYRFMGFVETFREMGFKEVGTAGSRRHIMVLQKADFKK